jgi:hypothetical protein
MWQTCRHNVAPSSCTFPEVTRRSHDANAAHANVTTGVEWALGHQMRERRALNPPEVGCFQAVGSRWPYLRFRTCFDAY